MLLQQLQEEYKSALINKDKLKKEILSFVIAQIKNKQIDSPTELTDDDVVRIIKKEIKTRQEAMTYMEQSGDQESLSEEESKVAILESYLPVQLTRDQLQEIVQQKIAELGIEDLNRQRGQLIGAIMKEYWGAVDGSLLNQVISDLAQQ